jgi:hypothetical protein
MMRSAAQFCAEDAESSYSEALVLADTLGMRPLAAHCHFGLGKLQRRTGDRASANEHLATATTTYREMGMTYWLDQALALDAEPVSKRLYGCRRRNQRMASADSVRGEFT